MEPNTPLLILSNSTTSGPNSSLCCHENTLSNGLVKVGVRREAMMEKVKQDDRIKAEEGSLTIRLQRKVTGPHSEKRKYQNEMRPMRILLCHNQIWKI